MGKSFKRYKLRKKLEAQNQPEVAAAPVVEAPPEPEPVPEPVVEKVVEEPKAEKPKRTRRKKTTKAAEK